MIKRLINGQERRITSIKKAVHLPDKYQEVEFLESTGSQVIITPFKFNYPVLVSGKILYTNDVAPTVNYSLFSPFGSTSASGYFGVDASLKWSLGNSYAVSVPWNEVLEFTYEKETSSGNATLTDQFGVSAKRSGTPTRTEMALFAASASGTRRKLRIYYIKVNSSNIQTHLIPCYRKSDNVAGMYDLVSGQFFTNSGTGEFIVGEAVNNLYVVDVHEIRRVVNGVVKSITV